MLTRARRILLCLAAPATGLIAGLSSPAAASSGPTVTVAVTSVGPTLVDGAGMALYVYSGDHDATATCTGACAEAWPPLTIPTGTHPTSGTTVTGTVGASPQPNGPLQVTYDGHPLYTFVGDTSPGQVNGDGSAGFSVVKVAPSPAVTTTTVADTPTTAAPVQSQGGAPMTAPAAPASAGPSSSPSQPASEFSSPQVDTLQATPPVLATTGLGDSAIFLALTGVMFVLLAIGFAGGPTVSAPRKGRDRASPS